MTTIDRIQAKYLSLLEEIAAAEKTAEVLREILKAEGVEFDEADEGNDDEPAAEKPARKKGKKAAGSGESNGTVEKIREYLKANGPTRIKEIAEATGLLGPTVSYTLKHNPDVFLRTDPGNRLSPWQLVE